MIKNFFSQNKSLTKHQVLKHFIETADPNCISHYYSDPYFKNVPNTILLEYIKELSNEGYLKPMQRHVVLKAKSYSYLPDRNKNRIKKFLSILGRPVSYLLTWLLGILSAIVIQYLLKSLGLKP